MQLKPLSLIILVLFSTGVQAERLALEDAAKQLLKDSAPLPSPAASAKTVDSAAQSVEKAKNLKESMERPAAASKEPAVDSAGAAGKSEPTTRTGKTPDRGKSTKPSVKNRAKGR